MMINCKEGRLDLSQLLILVAMQCCLTNITNKFHCALPSRPALGCLFASHQHVDLTVLSSFQSLANQAYS